MAEPSRCRPKSKRRAAVPMVLAGTKIIYGSHHKLHIATLTPKKTIQIYYREITASPGATDDWKWWDQQGSLTLPCLMSSLGWDEGWGEAFTWPSAAILLGKGGGPHSPRLFFTKQRWCLPTSRSFTGASSDARGAPTIPMIESFINLLLTLMQNGHNFSF